MAKGAVFSWKEALLPGWKFELDLAIARECKETIDSSFFALFTTVKVFPTVSKKSLLGWFLRASSLKHMAIHWFYLYMRSFLRMEIFFSMTLRLLALFPFLLSSLFPTPRSDCPCSLAQLLGYFQLLGLYSAFDYQLLTLLFPDEKGR